MQASGESVANISEDLESSTNSVAARVVTPTLPLIGRLRMPTDAPTHPAVPQSPFGPPERDFVPASPSIMSLSHLLEKFDNDDDDVVIYAGSGNPELAADIATQLGLSVHDAGLGRFKCVVVWHRDCRGLAVFLSWSCRLSRSVVVFRGLPWSCRGLVVVLSFDTRNLVRPVGLLCGWTRSDGEIKISIAENVRGKHVFIIQVSAQPCGCRAGSCSLVVGLGIVSRARKRVTPFPIGLCVCLQSTCAPVNDNVMELLLMIRAFRRAHAKSITAVLPYFAYSRGDQRRALRTPIPASAMAVLLEAAEVDRVVGLQLHSKQVGLGLL